MKIEDQVCTPEQAKRLKQLSIDDSLYCWVYPIDNNKFSSSKGICERGWAKQIVDENEGNEFDHDMAPAFSVAELGIMLPPGYDTMYCTNDGWRGFDLDGQDMCYSKPFNTEAEARAAMLIYLLETETITPAEVNERLKDKQ